MQAGVLIPPLYGVLQKHVLQTKALQKDATNKATLTSPGMIRQGNNPKPQAHIIPPIKQRKSTPWKQHQDSDSNSGNGTTCTPVWERDPSTYHPRTRRLPDDRLHCSQRQPEREEARQLRTLQRVRAALDRKTSRKRAAAGTAAQENGRSLLRQASATDLHRPRGPSCRRPPPPPRPLPETSPRVTELEAAGAPLSHPG